MTLGDYLIAERDKRWAAGEVDCCTLPADFVRSWGLGDPMAEWRGRYRTDDQARRLIVEAGGLVNLWQRGLEAIGVARVVDIQEGDVGVILGLNERREVEPVGAIFTGKRWAFRIPSGLAFASAETVRAWGPR